MIHTVHNVRDADIFHLIGADADAFQHPIGHILDHRAHGEPYLRAAQILATHQTAIRMGDDGEHGVIGDLDMAHQAQIMPAIDQHHRGDQIGQETIQLTGIHRLPQLLGARYRHALHGETFFFKISQQPGMGERERIQHRQNPDAQIRRFLFLRQERRTKERQQ